MRLYNITLFGAFFFATKALCANRSNPFQSDEHLEGKICRLSEMVLEEFAGSAIQCVAICYSLWYCIDAVYDETTNTCYGCIQNSDDTIQHLLKSDGPETTKYYVKRWTAALTCKDIHTKAPGLRSGVYVNKNGVEMHCDMGLGGWMDIQRRGVGELNFNETWNKYKSGFGNIHTEEMWFGLEKVAEILHTDGRQFELRVDLTSYDGQYAYAIYRYFDISEENDHYRLSVYTYSGTAGDALNGMSRNRHSGMRFSTIDSDSDLWFDGNCARLLRGGWWYDDCVSALLNGDYNHQKGIWWESWIRESLMKCSMKIREF